MTYTSKATSDGKINARRHGYSHMTQAQRKGYHVVIVGFDKDKRVFECEDIPYLLSIGIKPNRIIACGRGGKWTLEVGYMDAMKWASLTYGVVPSPYWEIGRTVEWALAEGYKLGSVNVDLCNTVHAAQMVLAPILKMITGCLALFTYIRARDSLGTHADSKRVEFLRRATGREPSAAPHHYLSRSATSWGSPMCVVVYQCRLTAAEKAWVTRRAKKEAPPVVPAQVELPKTEHIEALARAESTCSFCRRTGHNIATCGRICGAESRFEGMGVIRAIAKVIKEYTTAHGHGPRCGEILDRLPEQAWAKPYVRVVLCQNVHNLWKRQGEYGSSTYVLT